MSSIFYKIFESSLLLSAEERERRCYIWASISFFYNLVRVSASNLVIDKLVFD